MNKKLRCPMCIPGGIIDAIVGLIGMVVSFNSGNWMSFAFAGALFLIGGPIARITMMVHTALDQIEELKKK